MRVLIVSDIHGNLEALKAVLEAASSHEEVWNLGDLVGYGANPNEIIDISESVGSVFVRGNHDKACSGVDGLESFNPIAARAAAWTHSILTPEHLEWLRQLPAGPIVVGNPQASCAHGSPLDEDQYLVTLTDAAPSLAQAPERVNFFGHTHVQGAFATNGDDWFHLVPEYNGRGAEEFELPLRENARYLINPGSVGQPRDRDRRAAFAIYETEQRAGDLTAQRVMFYRVPYDVEQAQQKIREAGLPERLATRLAEGR
ncbi:MAG: metallophosphoesterase family protein [Acidobacteriaceae bacterium]